MAIDGVVAGFFFSNITVIQEVLHQKPIAIVPLLCAAGFLLISSGFSAYCIIPRLNVHEKRCMIFFCDIAENSNVNEYEKATNSARTYEKIEKDLINQIWANSNIAVKKYKAVTISIIIFVALVVSSILFMLVASWR